MKHLLPFSLLTALCFIMACSSGDPEPNPTPGPTGNPDPSLNKLAVGTSSNDFLAADSYDRLTIELVSVAGAEPDAATISSFQTWLEGIINKPNGVTIESSTVTNPGLAPYSGEDLRNFEDQTRTEYNDGTELTMFIFITEGSFTSDNVLGVAYRNTSFALFGGTIEENTGGLGQPSESLVTQTVLRHEMGHLLGLVNIGTPMQTDHQDTANGNHCDVESCLMYYAVESGDFIGNIVGGSNTPPSLDSQCMADLRANGGK